MSNETSKNTPVKDTQSRKYQITINNPSAAEPPFTHERIKEEVSRITSVIY